MVVVIEGVPLVTAQVIESEAIKNANMEAYANEGLPIVAT